jgi:aspartyl-tRNA(Asn)/glutamyl-tRNA(Gln) amidotransferase subunit C
MQGMSSAITKSELEHLAELARIQLSEKEEEKILKDLQRILEYVKELQTVNTEGVVPLAGGTFIRDVFRDDDERENTNSQQGKEQFPRQRDGFLEVPHVFE